MSDTIAKLRDLLLNSSKAGRLRGLLDSIYGAASTGAEAYGSASSPMSAEHSGLLGGLLLDMSPLGDAKSAYDGVQSAREGDWLGAGLGGLGALPMMPNLAGVVKGMPDAKWFHGTTKEFDNFANAPTGGVKLMDGLGTHFGTAESANQRIKKSYGSLGVEGANIRPLDPQINNPFTKKDGTPFSEAELQSRLAKIATELGLDRGRLRGSQHYPVSRDAQNLVKEELKRRGYDGVLYRNSHEDRGSVSGIAFDPPNQLKSLFE